jgi:hypothetical protein
VESYDKSSVPTENQVLQCEQAILNVLPHHCGDHSGCANDATCGFVRTKLDNGFQLADVLSREQYDEVCKSMFAKKRCRSEYYLQLNQKGLVRALREVTLRYNRVSIPQLAKKYTTSPVESLWSKVAQMSQGKRLNQNYSEFWEVAVAIAILSRSDPGKYIQSLYIDSLNLSESHSQKSYYRVKEMERHKSEKI